MNGRRLVVAVNTLSVTEANEGIRTVIRNLLPALGRVAPELHQLLLCSPANRALFPADADVVEVPLQKGRVLRRIAYDQLSLPRLVRGRADVLFTPSSVGTVLSPLPQVVFVQHHLALPSCRRLAGSSELSLLHRVYFGPLLRWSLRRADSVLGNSQFVADGLVHELGVDAAKVRALPLGVDPPTATAGDAREPIALFVGTLYDYKDPMTAVRAFARVQPELPAGARLVVVGRDPDGTQVARLRAAAEAAGVAASVELLGSVDDDVLDDLYRRASVLVMPSRCEGFGLPVAEAMRAGTVVVAADATALPEVAGGAAVLVPAGDVAGFADAIRRAMTEPDWRADLAARGLARSAELSWDASATRLRDAILAVAP